MEFSADWRYTCALHLSASLVDIGLLQNHFNRHSIVQSVLQGEKSEREAGDISKNLFLEN